MVRALTRSAWPVVVMAVGIVAWLCVSVESSAADVTSVRGEACGYYTNIGLFGGPQAKLGCEPQKGQAGFAPASDNTRSPSVTLPATGSATPITAEDTNGAAAQYGPAVIFGGIWEEDVLTAPPSGPIKVSTKGTTGGGGTVVSSTDIDLHPTPVPVRCYEQPAGTTNCKAPGGFGPPPVWGDKLHVECSATETAVTGSTTFTNAFFAKATDEVGGPLPADTEAIPDKPPPNYTKHGVITNVGDVFTAVFNEQIINEDGSLTVNAVHMYLYGPVAVGDMVKGQVTCGTTPTTSKPEDKRAPTCGVKVVAPVGPEDPTPKSPREELIGVFDAGGLQSIDQIKVTNGSVQVGHPSGEQYLQFTAGQKGPLTVTAKRTDEAEAANLTMTWSFDATDKAGNKRTCDGTGSPATDDTTSTSSTTSTTTTTVAGGSSSTTTTTSATTNSGNPGAGASTGTTAQGGTTTTTRAGTTATTAATQTAANTTATTRPPGTTTAAAANTTATQVPVALTG